MAFTAKPSAGGKLRASVYAANIDERTMLLTFTLVAQNVGPSNTTLQDVTNMSLTVVAFATYRFTLDLQYTSNATADIKIGFTVPTGATMDFTTSGYNAAGTFVTGVGVQSTVVDFSGASTSARLSGIVGMSSTAGVLQLQAAQNTSTAVTTNIEPGTTLTLLRSA